MGIAIGLDCGKFNRDCEENGRCKNIEFEIKHDVFYNK